MTLTRTTFFVIMIVIIIPRLSLATLGVQDGVAPLREKSLSDAGHPVERATFVNRTQGSHPQDILLELLDPQGLPVGTTSIYLCLMIESQERSGSQSEHQVSSMVLLPRESFYVLNQGQITIPYKAISKYAEYQYTTVHVSITHEGCRLGAHQSIPWQRKLPSKIITMELNPLCRVHGAINSSDLSKLGYPLDAISIHSSSTNVFYSSYQSTASNFELFLPPGNHRLHISSQSKTAKTDPIKQTILIEPGQREMDIGVIDLPANYLTSQFGQPAPELEAIQTWVNGSPVRLSDLKNKVVLLHFEGRINGINRYMDRLIDLHERYYDRGLVIVMIFNEPGDEKQFTQRLQEYCKGDQAPASIPFSIALDRPTTGSINRTTVVGTAHLAYHITRDPTNVLINQQGEIMGQLGTRFKDANEVIEALLAQNRSHEQSKGKEGTVQFELKEVVSAGSMQNEGKGANLNQGKPFTNSIGMKLVLIPAGEFLMGSGDSPAEVASKSKVKEESFIGEHPQHRVRIFNGFYLGVYEVTQAQYQAVMGTNPSHFKGNSNRPVESFNWYEAIEFCQRLSQKEGKTYRLPTEAEWEYACRAGTDTAFCDGNSLGTGMANIDGCISYGSGGKGVYRSDGVYRNTTVSVGSFRPNAWGLYDMHGNVSEWCQDRYDKGFYAQSPDVDPQGPASGMYRVMRGGSWNDIAVNCRSASRSWYVLDVRTRSRGFRVALDAIETPSQPNARPAALIHPDSGR